MHALLFGLLARFGSRFILADFGDVVRIVDIPRFLAEEVSALQSVSGPATT